MNKFTYQIQFLTCCFFLVCFLLPGRSFSQSGNEYLNQMDEAERIADSLALAESDEVYDEDEQKEVSFTNPAPRADPAQWRNLPEGYIQNLEKDKAFEYVKSGIPKPQARQQKKSGFTISKLILWLAVAAFAGFIIWYLVDNNVLMFRRKAAVFKESLPDDELPEDIFSIPYKDAILKAVQNNNYRLAIRLQYLQLLKTLSDRNIIKYRPDKTNFDYLMQLRTTDHYNDFFTATRNYEYSWYGLFDITEEMYQKIEPTFSKFYKHTR